MIAHRGPGNNSKGTKVRIVSLVSQERHEVWTFREGQRLNLGYGKEWKWVGFFFPEEVTEKIRGNVGRQNCMQKSARTKEIQGWLPD